MRIHCFPMNQYKRNKSAMPEMHTKPFASIESPKSEYASPKNEIKKTIINMADTVNVTNEVENKRYYNNTDVDEPSDSSTISVKDSRNRYRNLLISVESKSPHSALLDTDDSYSLYTTTTDCTEGMNDIKHDNLDIVKNEHKNIRNIIKDFISWEACLVGKLFRLNYKKSKIRIERLNQYNPNSIHIYIDNKYTIVYDFKGQNFYPITSIVSSKMAPYNLIKACDDLTCSFKNYLNQCMIK